MDLNHFLKKEQIVQLKSTEKQHVIRELLGHLEEIGLLEQSNRFYPQIIHRESIENTGIGNGLAIPHARSERVDSFITVFGISKEGIDYNAYDEEPVRFIGLSIFPTEFSTTYLYYIGMLARIFSNEKSRDTFMETTAPSKIHTLLQREVKGYFNQIDAREKTQPEAAANLSGVPSTDLDLIIRLDRLYNLMKSGQDSDAVRKKAEGLKKLIDNRSLLYYERMKKKDDNPFALIERESCTGCNMQFPPMEINRIKSGNELAVCSNCGRFLMIV
jgi:nitrogen PTS system EIIA component